MSSPSTVVNRGFVLNIEKLKEDGSNFIIWYRSLRILLKLNDRLHVMRKPLGEVPEDHASEEDDADYHVRSDDFAMVKYAMLGAMETGLRERLEALDTYEMIKGLKGIFASQVRIKKHQYHDHFFTSRMEENGSLQEHLDIMKSYHEHLVDLGSRMGDNSAIDGVIHSFPPSFRALAISWLVQGEVFTFQDFLVKLMKAKMELIAEEGSSAMIV